MYYFKPIALRESLLFSVLDDIRVGNVIQLSHSVECAVKLQYGPLFPFLSFPSGLRIVEHLYWDCKKWLMII